MKPASFLLLTLLLFFLYSNVAGQNIDLEMYCQNKSSICSMEFYPHCGSDDETYGNKCVFCNAYFRSGKKLQLRYFGIC